MVNQLSEMVWIKYYYNMFTFVSVVFDDHSKFHMLCSGPVFRRLQWFYKLISGYKHGLWNQKDEA